MLPTEACIQEAGVLFSSNDWGTDNGTHGDQHKLSADKSVCVTLHWHGVEYATRYVRNNGDIVQFNMYFKPSREKPLVRGKYTARKQVVQPSLGSIFFYEGSYNTHFMDTVKELTSDWSGFSKSTPA